MRKIFTLVVLFLLTEQFVTAQTVTQSTFNFAEAAAYEAAHPELFKPCPTCPRKEADGGWEEFVNPNMPFPPGANIKMSDPLPKRDPNEPRPDVPSRAPTQNFLGHVDPGNTIPPDTYGAVGLNHVMTTTNDFVKIHAKVGGAQISQVTISSFTTVGSSCDPQIFFDPSTQRWIFVAIGCAGNSNQVILMTSNTSDPTGLWRRITWVPLPGGLLDHPYLGYDDTKIAIGGRKFTPGFTGPELYLIDKADMLAGTAITFGTNAQTITKTAADGDSPRPVTVYFPPFSNSGNPSPGTIYIVQGWNNTSLRLTTVTGNIPTAVWNSGAAVFPSAPPAEAWTNGSHGSPGSIAQQAPEVRLLASNDARTSSAVMMNGKIWVSQHCAFPAGASGAGVTHTDVQYWQLEGNPGGTFGNVMQRGRTGAVPGQHRWFSSIAVNKNEDVIVGYSLSSTTGLPSAAYSTRQSSTPANTLDDPFVYHAGETRYWKDFGSGRARWGDYSQAHLDPVNNSLWTLQEYASTYAGFPAPFADNNSRSGVWWVQVPPSVVVPTPIMVASGATLVSESCVPNNGVIDPGETVTVSFCVQNTGAANTVNLVGTLLTSGGVITPSAPQNYGVVVAAGPPVCRDFTFTNNSTTCGATITASLQLQDGASNLGTVTYNFVLGTTVVAVSENFDAVVVPALPAGWVATNGSGPAPLWVSSNAGTPAPAALSAPNALFVDDPGVASDKRIETPAFVPGAGARATFSKNYSFETNWDGGVLEISINGGAYTDILTAGGSFVAGGYTHTLNASANPLGGRAAWSASSGGFTTTTVNLPNAAAGQSVKLRFRAGSDGSVSGIGWRIDNFQVSQPACCGAACTLTCPANITVNSASNACGANVSFAATATGLCGPITYSPASGSFFPVGTTTVNVSSASGATCSFTVTVVDNTPPTITCPANVVASNTPGLCSAVVTYALPTVTDNCPLPGQYLLTQSASTAIVPIQIGCQSGGLTTMNSWWRAYDLAPLALSAPLTIRTVTFGIETSNAASGTIPVTVKLYTSAGAFPGGTRTQIASQTVNVPNQAGTLFTVNLTTPPTVAVNAIVAVEVNVPDGRSPVNHTFFIGSNAAGQTAPGYIQAADCGIANPVTLASIGFPNDHIIINMSGTIPVVPPVLSLVSGIASGGVFPVGVTTNTYQARDAAGLTSTCSFTVTVNDVQAPTVTCPANIVRNTDPAACVATIATPNPTISDNCAVTKVTWVMTGATTGTSPATGINYVGTRAFNLNGTTGQGITTITYTVSDAAGNSTQCSFTVTVNDGQIPVISAQPANQFVCVGSNGAFSVTASVPTGSPLAYKWQKWDGATSTWVDVPGGTNAILPLNAVAFSQNTNSYRVILTGLCSVVTSNYATLYVNRLPTLSIAASRIPILLPGEFVNLVATVDPTGGTFQWFKDGSATPIPGVSGNTLSGLSVDDIGSYRVRYTDLNGCVSLSNEIVVSGAPSGNLYVFPNPNFGQFSVRFFNQVGETATLSVFDAKGARVYQRQMITTTAYTKLDIDLGPTVSSGVYLVEVVNGSGKSLGGKRIIVRHQ
ncbi:MAG: HYR domain-containing protein [Chitinophagaceae bacterium]